LATWSRAVNYLGACAISIPLTLSRAGLPIGLQLVGAAGDEDARRHCYTHPLRALTPTAP